MKLFVTPATDGLPMTQGREESALCHHQLKRGCEMPIADEGAGKFDQKAHEAFMRSLG
ncbi:hypothetical protein [Burkholderia sp. GbtcB21]|uniref:hypothetical protein n=1 Tax=Burkholderia sp. GbtcB21 TaxID=2824766 RepID=UPI001C2F9F58|nr:hypothetical protein [Burkholderia sp. GbtcB21]